MQIVLIKSSPLPYRRPRQVSFWRGFLSAFSFFPEIEYRSTGNREVDMVLGMTEDWANIGNDLHLAIRKARQEYGPPPGTDWEHAATTTNSISAVEQHAQQ
jgi:hypothetical protein